MNDVVDLLVLVDVELYAVDNFVEGVQDVVDAANFVVYLLLLNDVNAKIDADVERVVLDPDE